jgi:hypothetical protein
VPTADAALEPAADRGSARERLGLRAAILAAGLVLAAVIVVSDDRDPVVWAIPILVLTVLALVLLTLVDGRPEQRRLQRAARDLGLRHEPARTLPPVTPLLAALSEPRNAQTLEGDLDIGQPPVRLARVRLRGVDLAICLTDLPGSASGLEDPHGLLEPTGVAAAPGTPDRATAGWLADHPLRLGYATGDDALVAFCSAPRSADAPFRGLLDATRELHARLTHAL